MPSVLECLRNENFSGGIRQITEQQAKLVGMPWPLFSGWKELCKNIHITEQQAVEFKKYDREGRKAMKGLPIIPFNQRNLQNKVDVNSKDFYTSCEWRQLRYEAIKLHHGVCVCVVEEVPLNTKLFSTLTTSNPRAFVQTWHYG